MLTAEDLALYDDAIRSQLPPDAGSWLEPGNRAQAERQATAMVKGATAIGAFRTFAGGDHVDRSRRLNRPVAGITEPARMTQSGRSHLDKEARQEQLSRIVNDSARVVGRR